MRSTILIAKKVFGGFEMYLNNFGDMNLSITSAI